MVKSPKIALIGGGTGSFTILQSLKNLTSELSAIVNMSDDGGSTGRLRDELGVLPPGDVRQCLVALSELEDVRDLFNYRFGEGSLAGQSLGNIILSGLELQQGSFEKAIRVASAMLKVKGRVVPASLQEHILVMKDGDQLIRGEYEIAHRAMQTKTPQIFLEPRARVNPAAKDAISDADLVVIAPGLLYGSLLPALAVEGIESAIHDTKAKVVIISNLVNNPGQTDDWHVVDYVKKIEDYIGQGRTNFVLYNNQAPTKSLLQKYAADGEFPVDFSLKRFAEIKAKAIGLPLVAGNIIQQDKNDKAIRRTLIRHDATKVSKQLKALYRQVYNA